MGMNSWDLSSVVLFGFDARIQSEIHNPLSAIGSGLLDWVEFRPAFSGLRSPFSGLRYKELRGEMPGRISLDFSANVILF
jgi:hypothetical protein